MLDLLLLVSLSIGICLLSLVTDILWLHGHNCQTGANVLLGLEMNSPLSISSRDSIWPIILAPISPLVKLKLQLCL
jgi:hypothetical protein